MTPVEVRRSGTHLFHEVSVTQLIEGSSGGPAEWKDVSALLQNYLLHFVTNYSCILVPRVTTRNRQILMTGDGAT